MRNFRSKALRIAYHLSYFPFVLLDFFSPRIYMRFLEIFLAALGVVFEGRPRYISRGAKFDQFNLISLGENVVISNRVVLLTHDYSLTTGLRSLGFPIVSDIAWNRPIKVGSNVFIGWGSIILPGTVIGDNVIIGAGSVVRGNIEGNSIVLGNPALVVGKLSDKAERWKTQMSIDRVREDSNRPLFTALPFLRSLAATAAARLKRGAP